MCRYSVAAFTEHRRGYLHYGSDYRSPDWSFHSNVTTFAGFARRLEECLHPDSARIVYMQAVPIRFFPRLRREIRPISWLSSHFSQPCFSNFWIGSGGHVINTHLDFKNNLICMITGVKRFVVAPPVAMRGLYVAAIDRGVGGAISSLARLLEFDTVRFPRLVDSVEHLRVAVLGPGDAIFLPPCWWHHVESFGLNIMANAWRGALPFETEMKWLRALERSIVSMFDLGGLEKEILRAELKGEPMGQGLDRLLPDARVDRLRAHVAAVRAVHREAGPYFQEVGELLHDCYVFDRFGPPVLLPEGDRARMVARLTERLTEDAGRPLRGRIGSAIRALKRTLRQSSDWPVSMSRDESARDGGQPYSH
jgi:hypothetical protein